MTNQHPAGPGLLSLAACLICRLPKESHGPPEWSDALNLDLPLMDDTHREFVDLLAAVDQASDAELLPRWRTLVEHTEQHFARRRLDGFHPFCLGQLLTACSTRWCCR